MIAVKFQRTCAPYHAGETAAFDDAIATKYIAAGIAVQVELPKADEKKKA